MTEIAKTPAWWGRYNFDIGQSRAWQLGGLDLRVTRTPHEWSFQPRPRLNKQNEENSHWALNDDIKMPSSATTSRFFFSNTGEALYLLPLLADRSVVVKPVTPLFIPAGQSITLYVSTPVWLGCYVERFDVPVLDVPIVRPSDTWFGRDTIRGEICYATKVTARTDLSDLPTRPFRAITPVSLHNAGKDVMPVERINVPVPVLGVYASATGALWTQPLKVEHDGHNRSPIIQITNEMPADAGSLEMLSPPRVGAQGHALIRIFDNLFE